MTLWRRRVYNERRVENEIRRGTNRKGVGETNQCQRMGTEGTERSEGDLGRETATSHGPEESGGEARTERHTPRTVHGSHRGWGRKGRDRSQRTLSCNTG